MAGGWVRGRVQRSEVQLCSQLLLISNRRMTTSVSSPLTVVHGGIRQGLESMDSERLHKQAGGGRFCRSSSVSSVKPETLLLVPRASPKSVVSLLRLMSLPVLTFSLGVLPHALVAPKSGIRNAG